MLLSTKLIVVRTIRRDSPYRLVIEQIIIIGGASQVEITLLLVDPYGRNTTKADI